MNSRSFFLAHALDIVGVIAILFFLVHVLDTSVSGGQLNDDDHRFHLSELYLKKYACALKCTARVVAGNLIKDNKAL